MHTQGSEIQKDSFQKANFTCFQLVYGCIFDYGENVRPGFAYRHLFKNILAAFLQEHELILSNAITYGDITIYGNKVKKRIFSRTSVSAMLFAQ